MRQNDAGVWGLGVMGRNLALNLARHGFATVVCNRNATTTRAFVEAHRTEAELDSADSPTEFAAALRPPRKVIVMVAAGPPVDAVIDQLAPHLQPGDIVIEGGDSLFTDTIRRTQDLAERGVRLLGLGVSGGERGALLGPCLMASGAADAYEEAAPLLRAIAAVVDGEPCCSYVGPAGAGHFVKMAHNGIEYGDMQFISEAYQLMRSALMLNSDQMHNVFVRWNDTPLGSYLMEVTARVLARRDEETGEALVDVILDKASQKGTGSWTSQQALALGAPTPTIAEAVFARRLSALKDEREQASKVFVGPDPAEDEHGGLSISAIFDALHASRICCYAQGFALLATASKDYGWRIDLAKLARLWRGGCIIRGRLLELIAQAFDHDPALPNLLLAPCFRNVVQNAQRNWRQVVAAAATLGLPTPAMSSALAYFDGYRTARLSANLIQAQRNCFGAHAYERVDRDGLFHTDWNTDE